MKTCFLSLTFLLLLVGAYAQDATPMLTAEPLKIVDNGMRWEATTHDFGEIAQGIPQTAEFVVLNSGDEPLVIKTVKSTCGCTAAKHSEGPILPGESSTISATYNAKNTGTFRKSVKVMTNRSDTPIVLTVEGTVVKE